jgi:DNA polymerase-3 subunit delta
MASGAGGKGRKTAEVFTLETCLAEVRAGKPAPVYLFDGESFLATRAGRELAQALVPAEQRSLNLVELDGAVSPAEVAAELATRGLFGGSKVVLVEEPAFLQSKEGADDAFAKIREMWSNGRQREAARRLLALAAKAGWTAAELDPAAEGAPDAKDWNKELGVTVGAEDGGWMAELSRYAQEREMRAAKDDSSALDQLLARGLPPGHVLLITAGKVDGRLPMVKKLVGMGRRVSVAVEKEGQWDQERLVLGPLLATLVAGTGKSFDKGAEARLAELVGDDARTLAGEAAKLVAYVGDRKVIRAADVDEMVVRVAADPFFALGNAVEARSLEAAMGVLDRSLADGANIFMLLGSLASTVRRLIVEQERARAVAGGRRITNYNEWNALVLPSISEQELGAKKPYGFWMKYQAAARFSRGELLEALAALAEADHSMKTGAEGRPRVERLLWRLLASSPARAEHERSFA